MEMSDAEADSRGENIEKRLGKAGSKAGRNGSQKLDKKTRTKGEIPKKSKDLTKKKSK